MALADFLIIKGLVVLGGAILNGRAIGLVGLDNGGGGLIIAPYATAGLGN